MFFIKSILLKQPVEPSNFLIIIFIAVVNYFCSNATAQGQEIPPIIPDSQQPEIPQTLPPLPEITTPSTESDTEILLPPEAIPGSIVVKRFEIIGNTVLSSAEIEEIVKPYSLRQISFIELLEVPRKITQLYTEKGYINSGAVILPQTIKDRVVKITIIAGTIEDIKITGLKQLNEKYILNYLKKGTKTPLNQNQLLASLQLLQISPLIENVSAELSTGIEPNTSLLTINIKEANTFTIGLAFDNSKVASIGTFSRQIELNENNLLGIGDRFNIAYTNTDGSNTINNISYELPITQDRATIKLAHSRANNEIIQEPFDELNIENKTRIFELSYTQPLYQSVYQEFDIGFNLTRESSQTTFLEGEPFPNISSATDEDGKTIITTIGFFQDYIQRDEKQVFFLRSHFSLGIDALDSVTNENKADSEFVAWRGFTGYLRALSPKNTLFINSNIQLANDSLAPIEQFVAGGFFSVRGYPQNILSGDNGIFFSTEIRHAIIKDEQKQITLELIPFIDFGKVWNTKTQLDRTTNTLAAIGTGLKLTIGDNLTARIDYGIPLVEVETSGDSLQENGIYFSLKSSL